MKQVFVRENVYYNSTPKEFDKFMNFLKKAVPYDVVIDGLNVAWMKVAADITNLQKAENVRISFIIFSFQSCT